MFYSMVNFGIGGVNSKDIWSYCNFPIGKAKGLPIEALWVPGQYNPRNKVWGWNNEVALKNKETPSAHGISGDDSTMIY